MEFGDIPRPSRHGAGRASEAGGPQWRSFGRRSINVITQSREAMNLGRLSHPDVLWSRSQSCEMEVGWEWWCDACKLQCPNFSHLWNGMEIQWKCMKMYEISWTPRKTWARGEVGLDNPGAMLVHLGRLPWPRPWHNWRQGFRDGRENFDFRLRTSVHTIQIHLQSDPAVNG